MVVGWAPRWTGQTERTSLLTLGGIPDETTILSVRHQLEKHMLGERIFKTVKLHPPSRGGSELPNWVYGPPQVDGLPGAVDAFPMSLRFLTSVGRNCPIAVTCLRRVTGHVGLGDGSLRLWRFQQQGEWAGDGTPLQTVLKAH